MRRLMLLRHAKADRPLGVNDHERPLAARGLRQSQEMGMYMEKQGLVPDLAIVSTSIRTQDTWRLASTAIGLEITRQDEPRIYEGAPDEILHVIRTTDPSIQTLLLVGHNPGFEHVATSLVGAGRAVALSRLQHEFPTGALAVIDFTADNWAKVAAGEGYLDRFETLASISS